MNLLRQVLPALVFIFFLPLSVQAGDKILVLKISGPINPVVAEYVSQGIRDANRDGAPLVVLQMDTPGGLDTSMRIIIKEIQSSLVPVATFVAPGGSRAASAGAFISIASHIAAMSPGTNIGAAHPVNMLGGGQDGKNKDGKNVMQDKIENDAAAYIRSLAELRGRNAFWAEMAVRKSVSISETEAMKLNVIDLVAVDLDALLLALEDREVAMGKNKIILKLEGKERDFQEMNKRQKFLDIISSPNIAYMLLMVGMLGLYLELSNPGLILPGVIGGVSLILALYAMQALPINYAGLLLILLGAVLLIAELNVPSFGLLSSGAAICILLGSIFLMDTDDPALQISRAILYPTVGAILLASFGIAYLASKIRTLRPVSGAEALLGASAVVKTELNPEGSVFLHGEIWNASCENQTIPVGESVIVDSVNGLKLKVRKP